MKTVRTLKILAYAVLAIAIAVGWWFEQLARASAGVKVDVYSLWIASPLVLMGVAVAIANSLRAAGVLLALSALFSISGVLIYWDTLFVHVDAQGALIFLFLPLYQLVVVALVLVGTMIARIHRRRSIEVELESKASKTVRISG